MASDHALHGGQPDAVARKFTERMQALERREQAIDLRGIEANPVVANEIVGLAVLDVAAEFDLSRLPCRGEFPRVSEQIHHCDMQQAAVAFRVHCLGNDPAHGTCRRLLLQLGGDFAHHRTEVYRFAAHLRARQSRELQQVFDQRGHLLRPSANPLQAVAPLAIQPVVVVLKQDATEAIDRAQRCAQIV